MLVFHPCDTQAGSCMLKWVSYLMGLTSVGSDPAVIRQPISSAIQTPAPFNFWSVGRQECVNWHDMNTHKQINCFTFYSCAHNHSFLLSLSILLWLPISPLVFLFRNLFHSFLQLSVLLSPSLMKPHLFQPVMSACSADEFLMIY